MAINHVILHEVKRDKDGEHATKNLRIVENNVQGLGKKLTDQLMNLFAMANLNIGEFGLNSDPTLEPAFEQKLNQFYKPKKLECRSFVDMTRDMAVMYQDIINEQALYSVKGGILVFYEYEQKNNTYLGIAVVDRIDGINADNKSLDLTDSTIIDLNRLHLGASINLTKWKEEGNTRYIRFKTGRAVEVRDYFERFIGCQRDKKAAIKETRALKNVIQAYGKSKDLNDDEIAIKIQDAHSFISHQQKKGKEVLLSSIANSVFPDSPEDFLVLAKSEKYEISEQIAISSAELKRYVRLAGRSKTMSISFDMDLLDDVVQFDEKNETLIFNEIPVSLKDAILAQKNPKKE
ncbi:nucleoid-associated protein [Aliivibrio sifiae]|uniref:nucleoid-associated protein n=1 Tax=Aliivibrio sifiae TaxID=566293 RepID=UPI003D0B3CB2